MIKLYFSLKLLMTVVIILIILIGATSLTIKSKLDSKFKQNCYKCKHYELYDVASCGGKCTYKCMKKNRLDCCDINDNEKFIKCEEFENKEV